MLGLDHVESGQQEIQRIGGIDQLEKLGAGTELNAGQIYSELSACYNCEAQIITPTYNFHNITLDFY